MILSGANKDGAYGLKRIQECGGHTIVQDPNESQISMMPNAAIKLCQPNQILTIEEISKFINELK